LETGEGGGSSSTKKEAPKKRTTTVKKSRGGRFFKRRENGFMNLRGEEGDKTVEKCNEREKGNP